MFRFSFLPDVCKGMSEWLCLCPPIKHKCGALTRTEQIYVKYGRSATEHYALCLVNTKYHTETKVLRLRKQQLSTYFYRWILKEQFDGHVESIPNVLGQMHCVNTSLDRASHCPERNHRKSNVQNDVPVTSSLSSQQSVLRPYLCWAPGQYKRARFEHNTDITGAPIGQEVRCVSRNAFAGCWVQFVQSSQGLYRACHPTARVKPSEDEWRRVKPSEADNSSKVSINSYNLQVSFV